VIKIFLVIKDSLELNAIPKEAIKVKLKETFNTEGAIDDMLNNGGLMGLLAIPVTFLVIGLIVLFSKCIKNKHSCCAKIVAKIKAKVCFNLLIRTFLTSYLPLAISSGLGRQLNNDPETTPNNFYLLGFILIWLWLNVQFSLFMEVDELDHAVVQD